MGQLDEDEHVGDGEGGVKQQNHDQQVPALSQTMRMSASMTHSKHTQHHGLQTTRIWSRNAADRCLARAASVNAEAEGHLLGARLWIERKASAMCSPASTCHSSDASAKACRHTTHQTHQAG
eukprot:2668197-Rhodomonas_salina.3